VDRTQKKQELQNYGIVQHTNKGFVIFV
jgi:hypothetical protein